MILIFTPLPRVFFRPKHKSAGYQLENRAAERPDIRGLVVAPTDHNLRTSEVSGLDHLCEVLVGEASISHIYYLDFEVFHLLIGPHINWFHRFHMLHTLNIPP